MPLQVALDNGGAVHVCPGRYSRSYTVSQPVKIIGAGDGDDPSANTVLGYPGNTALQIEYQTGTVELERLRISNGRSNGGAGGISHGGTSLLMTDCTVSGNTANYGAGIMVYPGRTLDMLRCKVIDNIVDQSSDTWGGGGILTDGTTTLTDCLVANNHGGEGGGGIYVGGGTTQLFGSTKVRGNSALRGGGLFAEELARVTLADTCLVTGNRALEEAMGGGIATYYEGTVKLLGADPSPIVVNNCPDNCQGPIDKCGATPVECPD
jgi:hypothetical protein